MDKNIKESMVPDLVRDLFCKLSPEEWIDIKRENAETRLAIVEKAAKLVKRFSYKLKKKAEENTSRMEYCKNKEMLERGCYRPDPLEEIIVTNIRRGRPVKKKPDEAPYYAYHFDEKDNLILIEGVGIICDSFNTIELLFRFGNYRVGFKYVENSNAVEPYIDVTVECKSSKGDQYIISRYSLIRSKKTGSYSIRKGTESVIIGMENGLPVKQTELSECWDYEPYMLKILGLTDPEYNILTREFSVYYDENGLPYKCSNGKGECFMPGKIKSPNLSGMFK
jgi:hypothetical protein